MKPWYNQKTSYQGFIKATQCTVNINLIAFMKPSYNQKTSATFDITAQANILPLLRYVHVPHPQTKRGQNLDFRGHEHSYCCIQILIASRSSRDKTPYSKHESATSMSTFCVTNNSDSSNIF